MTDRRSLSPATQGDALPALLDKIEQLAAAGVDWIQLREKDLSGRHSASLAREALERIAKQAISARTVTQILVNDRLDVAIAERANGVHLGDNSLSAEDAKLLVEAPHSRRAPGHDFLIGVSTHSLEAAKSAAASGANYIFFGPVFATPSKAQYGSPQGLDQLVEVCASVTIPVLAIGGITLENAAACFATGAAGIAAIRLFQDAADPAAVVHALREQAR